MVGLVGRWGSGGDTVSVVVSVAMPVTTVSVTPVSVTVPVTASLVAAAVAAVMDLACLAYLRNWRSTVTADKGTWAKSDTACLRVATWPAVMVVEEAWTNTGGTEGVDIGISEL